jgi:hypothetical protein
LKDTKIAEQQNEETGEKLQTSSTTVKKWERRQYNKPRPQGENKPLITRVERTEEQRETVVKYTGKPGQFQRRLEGDTDAVKQITGTPDQKNEFVNTLPAPGEFVTAEPQVVSRTFSRESPVRKTKEGTIKTRVTGREDVRQVRRLGAVVDESQGDLKEVRETTTVVRRREEKIETLEPPGTRKEMSGVQQAAPRAYDAGRGRGGLRQFITSKLPQDQQLPQEAEGAPRRPFTRGPRTFGAPRTQAPRSATAAPEEIEAEASIEEEIEGGAAAEISRKVKLEKKKQTVQRKYGEVQTEKRAGPGRKRKEIAFDEEKPEAETRTEEAEIEEKAVALSFGDENPDVIQESEINNLLNMYKDVESTKATREFYEQNMHNDAALGTISAIRDVNPTTVSENIRSLQTAARDALRQDLDNQQITEKEAELYKKVTPVLFKDYPVPKAADPIEYMMNPSLAINELTAMTNAIQFDAFINYEAAEDIKEIQLSKLEKENKLTPELLKAYESNIPVTELFDAMLDDLHTALLMGHKPTPELVQKVINNHLSIGRAARKRTQGAQEQFNKEAEEGLRKKAAELLIQYTPDHFARKLLLKDTEVSTPDRTYVQAMEFLERTKEEIKAKEEADQEEGEMADQDYVMSHHICVKEKRFFHLLHTVKNEFIEPKVDMPHIPDTVATSCAGKYGKQRVLAPMERYFDEIIESAPEGPVRERLEASARAVARNKSFTIGEKKDMLYKIRDNFIAEKIAQYYEPPSAILPGKRSHMHPNRVNPRDRYSIKTHFKPPKTKRAVI